ncbi:MAG TPA: tRNA (N(6)-L-threonylcarbamoyladenosine(37)-C(2))-methylthiotransferase MtaB, partial [Terriglobales bacterium]|nr:tRNA (N(6)-L-threonylcarbamoyladenosine(37)-C(2))-methylthiotransferase MtaB [Terriglobales bacterium]
MSSFYVENFGCRATQADGAAVEQQLLRQGLHAAASPGAAQVVVLNTCTVTAAADQDARAAIRRIHRENPGCQILVTGCYAQRAPEELASLPGVRWVVGNSHKHQIAELIARDIGRNGFAPDRAVDPNFLPLSRLQPASSTGASLLVGDIFAHTELLAAPVFDALSERTRPNLKVQDGCNNRCSFCVIPYVRGRSRSLPWGEVIGQVNHLVAAGYREVVISGINLGRWGRDLRPQLRFPALVRAILQHTSLQRLRLSSIEPMDWSDELIELAAGSPRIAKHAHVPMQSGSDRILRRMHRKYRPWHYAQRLLKIRHAVPTAAIGADVMVGFPGESEADFEQTRAMVEELPFTYLHVFTYSARPGTPAASLPEQVQPPVAHERSRVLRELAAQKKLAFQGSFLGKELQAITLSRQDGERTEALTDNYLKLQVAGRHAPNQWVTARIESVSGGELWGMLSRPESSGCLKIPRSAMGALS